MPPPQLLRLSLPLVLRLLSLRPESRTPSRTLSRPQSRMLSRQLSRQLLAVATEVAPSLPQSRPPSLSSGINSRIPRTVALGRHHAPSHQRARQRAISTPRRSKASSSLAMAALEISHTLLLLANRPRNGTRQLQICSRDWTVSSASWMMHSWRRSSGCQPHHRQHQFWLHHQIHRHRSPDQQRRRRSALGHSHPRPQQMSHSNLLPLLAHMTPHLPWTS